MWDTTSKTVCSLFHSELPDPMFTTRLPKWAGAAVLAGMVGGSHAEAPAMRDAATHDELVPKLRQVEQNDPMKHLPAAKGRNPSAVFHPKDILSQSDIISFQGLATLVPKHAILLIPKNYQNRIAMQPDAKIVSWADFYVANRGWITTVEVNRTQAEGNLALPDKTQKRMSESGNLVVATYMGGPISVLPLKESKASDPKDSNTNTSNAKTSNTNTSNTTNPETSDTPEPAKP